jgi:hypothetical protein
MRPLFAALVFVALPLAAQTRLTEHTMQLEAGQKAAPASADDMSFMAGRWLGEGMGGQSEELWGPVYNGRMLGTYTHSEKSAPVFHELMLVAEIGGQLMVRLKHFNPDLTGWEEKDKFVDFPFVAKKGGAMYFRGLTYAPSGPDTVRIYLAMKDKDGKRSEELFVLSRAK